MLIIASKAVAFSLIAGEVDSILRDRMKIQTHFNKPPPSQRM